MGPTRTVPIARLPCSTFAAAVTRKRTEATHTPRTTARRDLSSLFFGVGRAVASPYQLSSATTPSPHTPVLPPHPKNNTKSNSPNANTSDMCFLSKQPISVLQRVRTDHQALRCPITRRAPMQLVQSRPVATLVSRCLYAFFLKHDQSASSTLSPQSSFHLLIFFLLTILSTLNWTICTMTSTSMTLVSLTESTIFFLKSPCGSTFNPVMIRLTLTIRVAVTTSRVAPVRNTKSITTPCTT